MASNITLHQCTFTELELETYGQLADEATREEPTQFGGDVCTACGTENDTAANPYLQDCTFCGRPLWGNRGR